MVLECLKVIKDQFYEECAAELLKLIKEHTEKVNIHTHFFLIHTTFDSFFYQYGKGMLRRGLVDFETFLQAFSIIIQTNLNRRKEQVAEIWKKFLTNVSDAKTLDAKHAILAL